MKVSNHALLFITAGIYLALGAVAGYSTINAMLLLFLGIYRFRWDRSRFSVVLIAISLLILILNQLLFVALILLISLGTYYYRARPPVAGTYVNKHQLLLNLHLDEQSWLLHSMSFWHVLGEIRMDLTMAIPEEKETTIILQGIVGDVDIIVPDDYGIQVEASVLLGQIGLKQKKESGVLHRYSWKSPDYEQSEYRLKLQLLYLVGDIKIRSI
ncbi:MAG: cell wall-active antibiotics response protein LiaF [Candidatus Cohnella colombiensis]|uniref:Cell wall-active antibiotics response protein LiaF n=1 Tax=Candidatus Cohnella colombiensis TaxID=3121368 RepID=A0AA95EYB5_9BACL|nr:MAG: cell wall-active antibiotics response protein LiaF [Cohnella sp.]